MKVVVLGAGGQLGRDLVPRLPGEVVPITREQIDLARPDGIRPAVEALRPAVLVNCAAYNFVDKAEAEPDAATPSTPSSSSPRRAGRWTPSCGCGSSG